MKRMMIVCLSGMLLVGSTRLRANEPPSAMPEGPITLMADSEPVLETAPKAEELPVEPKKAAPVAPPTSPMAGVYPECCQPQCQPSCCQEKRGGCWFSKMRDRFSRRHGDDCCEQSCQQPACSPPACDSCDSCAKPNLLQRIRSRFGCRGCEQAAPACSSCGSCGSCASSSSCGERVGFRERCRHTWEWLTYRSADRYDSNCMDKDLMCKHPPLYTYFACPAQNCNQPCQNNVVQPCQYNVPAPQGNMPMEQGPAMMVPQQ